MCCFKASNVGSIFSMVLPPLANRIILAILTLHALIVELYRHTTSSVAAGGQGGHAPLTTACVSHFGLVKILFLERHATTRQQTMMKKEIITRGGVEGTRLKAKDTKKIRGQGKDQGQPFRGQTLSRPRTGMLEAKDQVHSRKCSPKTKRSSKKFFRQSQIHRRSQNF